MSRGGRRPHRASSWASSMGFQPPRLEQCRARGPIGPFGKMPHAAALPAPEEIDLSMVDRLSEIDHRATIALRAVRPCCRHSAHSSQFRGVAAYPIRTSVWALDRNYCATLFSDVDSHAVRHV